MQQFPNDEVTEEPNDDTVVDEVSESEDPLEEVEVEEEGAEEPAGPRLILKRSGEETDIVFPFSAPASIGRFDPSVGPVDIDLGSVEEGNYVSRKHAKIVFEEDAFHIEDTGSSNGTYVLRDDFEKVDKAEIVNGDEISLGNARFVFRT